MTRVLHADRDDLTPAIESLRRGGLVAFPTETVYGLGALAADPEAVAAIFHAKGRPQDNPLIVHLDGAEDVHGSVADWPPLARELAAAFWPGPLTLVAERHPDFPAAVSAGLATIAVRVPDHPVARALIRGAGPLAAPSANRSGRPSPTTAQHVIDDLAGRVDFVIDAGACRSGLESTVVDVSVDPPMVLRPGAIPIEILRDVVPSLVVHDVVDSPETETDARAPGMRHRHYSPRAEVWLVEGDEDAVSRCIARELEADPTSHAVVVGIDAGHERVHVFEDVEALARGLYACLRACDAAEATTILVAPVPAEGVGRTLLNRLRKAASRRLRV